MVYHDQRMCCKQKSCPSSKFKVIDHTLTVFIGYNKSKLYPAHNFVLYGGISKSHGKTSVVRKDHVASLKVKIIIYYLCCE